MDSDTSSVGDAFTDLEEKVKSVPIEASKETLKSFEELLSESTKLVKNASATQEIIKDAYVISALASSVHESAKCINISESNFDPQSFAIKVVQFISNHDIDGGVQNDWSRLSHESKFIYKYAPGLTYISAYKSDEPSSQVANIVERRARQAKKPLETLKEPERVKTITKTDEGVHSKEKMYAVLTKCFKQNREKPICFFKFVTDPCSFSKTVENIFCLSFLARDGDVQMSLDDHKLPVLTPKREQQEKNIKRIEHKNKVQMLVSLTPSQWQAIVREFEITEAVIP